MKDLPLLGCQAGSLVLALLMTTPGLAQEKALTLEGQRFLAQGMEQLQARGGGGAGSNGQCNGSYLCTAGPGYDGPTGLGTPNGIAAFGF